VLVERLAAALNHVADKLDAFMSNEPDIDPIDIINNSWWTAPARAHQRAVSAREKLRISSSPTSASPISSSPRFRG
jgi:hypothetical protein